MTLPYSCGMCQAMLMARQKKMVSLALDPALLVRLDKWLAAQEFPPTKTAVMEAALKLFLDGRDDTKPARRK